MGLSCKVLLADQLAPLWASIERIGYEYLSTPLAWLGAVSYRDVYKRQQQTSSPVQSRMAFFT